MPLADPASGKPGTVLITGTTSGVGLNALKSLHDRGWTVVTANRDPVRAAAAANSLGIDSAKVHHLRMDLGDLESVRVGVETLVASLGLPLDALVINAAVYKPRLKQPEWSPQGYEISMATNHLGHFLLIQLLLEDLKRSTHPSPRVVIMGTVTANSKELGGKIPIPAPADLGDLAGFKAGFKPPIAMASGKAFKPGTAYKDSKLCNMSAWPRWWPTRPLPFRGSIGVGATARKRTANSLVRSSPIRPATRPPQKRCGPHRCNWWASPEAWVAASDPFAVAKLEAAEQCCRRP